MAAGTRPVGVPVYLGQLVQFGTITTPVPFLDVNLPAGYSRFVFWFYGVTVSGTGDNVAAAIYVAGGFENDPAHNDTYFTAPSGALSSLIVLTPQQSDQAHSVNHHAACLVDIYPGDLETYPFVIVNYAWGQASGGVLTFQQQSVTTLYGASTVPRSKGPATLIRVLPKGAGNVNPPTSGETMESGSWRLYAYN